LQSSIHQEKIKFTDTVADELKVFEYTFSNGSVKYSAPNGFHDDMVMALALANFSKIEAKSWNNYNASFI
jgi:hypothetical protein